MIAKGVTIMAKPTEVAIKIKKVVESYRNGTGGIHNKNVNTTIGEIMNTFAGVFCGVSEHKSGLLFFTVTSAKSKKKYLEVLVNE